MQDPLNGIQLLWFQRTNLALHPLLRGSECIRGAKKALLLKGAADCVALIQFHLHWVAIILSGDHADEIVPAAEVIPGGKYQCRAIFEGVFTGEREVNGNDVAF